jgi:hypothetical protein
MTPPAVPSRSDSVPVADTILRTIDRIVPAHRHGSGVDLSPSVMHIYRKFWETPVTPSFGALSNSEPYIAGAKTD